MLCSNNAHDERPVPNVRRQKLPDPGTRSLEFHMSAFKYKLRVYWISSINRECCVSCLHETPALTLHAERAQSLSELARLYCAPLIGRKGRGAMVVARRAAEDVCGFAVQAFGGPLVVRRTGGGPTRLTEAGQALLPFWQVPPRPCHLHKHSILHGATTCMHGHQDTSLGIQRKQTWRALEVGGRAALQVNMMQQRYSDPRSRSII